MATDPAREHAADVMAVMVERMQQYERLLADLRAGRIERPEFRRKAVVTGIVQQMDGVWIFDLANTRWVYYDGVELRPVRDEQATRAPKPRRPRG
jgi:hypothetical protein